MTTLIDIFVGNETLIDLEIYKFWLNGNTATEVAKQQLRKGSAQEFGVSGEMLANEIQDQYRTFAILEDYLKNPLELSWQLELQITPKVQNELIEKYYNLDASVAREILGKKLSARVKSSLDDVTTKTGVPYKSCKRQFENIKRIYKTVEEQSGVITKNIKNSFLLSDELAKNYSTIIFLITNKFNFNKKKLNNIFFDDLIFCSDIIMANWSYKDLTELNDSDLDRNFFSEIKEIKIIIDKDNNEEHKNLLLSILDGKINVKTKDEFNNNFKSLSKALVTIGINLIHTKDLKEFFYDLYDKIIEPCLKGLKWDLDTFDIFVSSYQATFSQLNIISKSGRVQILLPIWNKYMNTITACLKKLYHN